MIYPPTGLLHRHGDDDWSPMEATDDYEHTSPDDNDYERRLRPGRRIFRCVECDVQVAIEEPEEA